jgi:REP element-mobilizing transposase RayT
MSCSGFRGWHERGYLPHRDEPGLTQFVTFGLADAFPAALRAEWATLLKVEDNGAKRRRIEAYLDSGRGTQWLRRPDIAGLVEVALGRFHKERYELKAWVVMPNHVHVLIAVSDLSLSRIVEGWKSFTAHAANRLLNRKGPFWASDYWDIYMRSVQHELAVRRYIENNPVKACLVSDPRDWPWSSARHRDESGALRW